MHRYGYSNGGKAVIWVAMQLKVWVWGLEGKVHWQEKTKCEKNGRGVEVGTPHIHKSHQIPINFNENINNQTCMRPNLFTNHTQIDDSSYKRFYKYIIYNTNSF